MKYIYENKAILVGSNDDGSIHAIGFTRIISNKNGLSLSKSYSDKFSPPSTLSQETLIFNIINELKVDLYLEEELNALEIHNNLIVSMPAPIPVPAPPIVILNEEQEREKMFNDIDDYIGRIIFKKTRFEMGYIEREKYANEYKDSGYKSTPSEWITRFADNVKIDYKTAALLILSQAKQYRKALFDLDNLRMDKYLVKNASTLGESRNEFTRVIYDASVIAEGL
jgi:hypothetical protein